MQDDEWLLPFSFNISQLCMRINLEGFYRNESKRKHKLPYASRIVIKQAFDKMLKLQTVTKIPKQRKVQANQKLRAKIFLWIAVILTRDAIYVRAEVAKIASDVQSMNLVIFWRFLEWRLI